MNAMSLEVLLNYYKGSDVNSEIIRSASYEQSLQWLKNMMLLQRIEGAVEQPLQITEKGIAFIQIILQTEMPVQKWVAA